MKRFIISSLFAFTCFSVAVAASGCTKEEGQEVKSVATKEAINGTLCVLQNISLPPEKIAKWCGGMTLADVQNVLAQTPPEMQARLIKPDAGAAP